MPSTIRRSEQLQKRLQRRNNSLKPADFTKVQTPVSSIEKKPDPVEKSKAALSDLRKRIDERKKSSKMVDVQQYQEKREDAIPELTGATFSESPMSQRQPASPKPEISTRAVMRSTAPPPAPPGALRTYYNNAMEANILAPEEKAPPSHIEVTSENKQDDDTEVSEITTDVRIMSTKGAAYAERRMAGNVQMRLARPALSTPTARLMTPTGPQVERDVSINVSNLKDLGKAVEQAKMDMQKELSPVNDPSRRHGLPYESTDYQPSADEDEVSSWGNAIRTDARVTEEQKAQFIADKNTAKKVAHLVKEAYSYEGDVFIDATDVKEEDLDGGNDEVADDDKEATPMEAEDDEVEQFHSSEQNEDREEVPVLEMEEESVVSDMDRENAEADEEPAEEKPADFANNPAAMATEFFNNSVGFFKNFGTQVENQVKSLQQKGLIAKNDIDGMLGILNRDVKEAESNLSKEADEANIRLGDDFEDMEPVQGTKNSTGSEVEKVLDSLKKSYTIGISKCGLDSDFIKENTKAIDEMVANLKNASVNPSDDDQNETTEDDIDGAVFTELSAQRAEDDAVPLTGANGVMLSVGMPENE